MNLKLLVAVSLLTITPALAQGPGPKPPKPTLAAVQKVVKDIGGDPVKLKAYCDLAKINEQMSAADEKKDTKTVEALAPKADALAEKLGPDYAQIMDGLDQVDENSADGKAIAAAFGTLDKQCK